MKEKTILITGAGSGLGKGTALGLAAKGHKVIAGVHKWEQKSRLLKDSKKAGVEDNLEIIKLNILDLMDCQKAWEYDIDILVNNAGIGHSGPVSEMPVGLIREVMETNVFSNLEFAQPFIKKMIEKGTGKLVFVSSVAGLSTTPYLGAYNASKHALEAIAQSLRDELTPMGLTVATINPGPYDTGFNDRMYDNYAQWFDKETHFTPLKNIEAAAKSMAENQFNPKGMIEKMIEIIPQESHNFRTILPVDFADMCKSYQEKQYSIQCDTAFDFKD
ncbi:SDR family oxidoreductase [uncultured Winogradskyella sp.]|uniref:SDR family oxidoreductase n=1 Tax=uncultured Winogradskyella sp. TaxID=395353 RepID=UPI00260B1BD7|nr:SDR family oxidoreductase [uncultured Winogradskyella sp.]